MKPIRFSVLAMLALVLTAAMSLAAESDVIRAVQAADDARVAAMIAGDTAKLQTLFSADLQYGHTSGAVDTKASLLDTLATKRTRYLAIDYESRNFKTIAPGIVLMTGRANMRPQPAGKDPIDMYVSYLGVWREEQGACRLVAWQSAKIPPPAK